MSLSPSLEIAAPAAAPNNGAIASRQKFAADRLRIGAEIKRVMDERGCTFRQAAKGFGLSAMTVTRIKTEMGINDRAAIINARRAARARQVAAQGGSDEDILRRLRTIRHTVSGLGGAATQMSIHPERARRIWNAAHPGERYAMPKAPKVKVAQPPLPAAVGRVVGRMSFTPEHQMTAEQVQAKNAAIAHAKRTAMLPPVTDDEAGRLVAEYLARKPVTVCPGAVALTPNNAGAGWRGGTTSAGGFVGKMT